MAWVDEIGNAIAVLNRIHEADPTVLQKLIFHRVPCNKTLAADPTVQVGIIGKDPDEWEVGLLGIINGLFGVNDRGSGFIAVTLNEYGIITGFMRLRNDGN